MKTILITGASDGIGKHIALSLAENDCTLILCGRNEDKLKAVQTEVEANGSVAVTSVFDIADSDARKKSIESLLAEYQVDVLINNAGLWLKAGDLTSLSEEEIESVVQVNLTGQMLLTRQLLASMRSREGTAIVNIVSKAGVFPQIGLAAYSASKYGMKGFTDVLREDTKEEPIRIAGVYQAGTRTGMFAKGGEEFDTEKFTEPEDLAEVVKFMLSRPKKIWLNEVHVTF